MTMTKLKLLSIAALACACCVAGVQHSPAQSPVAAGDANATQALSVQQAHYDALPNVVATYDGGQFTKEELSATLRLRKPPGVQFMAPNDILSMAPDRLRSIVSDLVFERLLVQKALEEGVDKTTSGIRERLEKYEEEVFNRLYFERVFGPELEAAREKMLREAYERDKATKYTLLGHIRLAEIFFSGYRPYQVYRGDTLAAIAQRECGDARAMKLILRDEPFHYLRRSPGVDEGKVEFIDVRPGEKLLLPLRADEMTSKAELARRVLGEIRRGGDFLELARKYSEAPEGRRDEIFDFDPMFDPAVVSAVEKTATTSVTDVLRTRHGLHILKVVDRTETKTLTFEQVRDSIQLDPELVRKAEETARKNLVDRLRDKYHLEINHDALKRDDYQGTDPLTASTWIARMDNCVYTLDDFRKELMPFQKSWRGLTYQERLDFVKASPQVLKYLIKLESKSLGLQNDPQYRAEMDSKAVIDVTTAYLRQLEAKLPPISEAEMREWYDSHLDQFTGTPKVKLREITKKVNPLLADPERSKVLEDARQKLLSIRERIRTPQDFEEMARRESDAIGTRSRGGLIGVVPLGFRGEAFQNQIQKLKPGQVSEPFLYGTEMVIIMLEEKVAAPVMSFDEAKPRIQRILEEQRRKKMRDELREQLFQEKHVKILI